MSLRLASSLVERLTQVAAFLALAGGLQAGMLVEKGLRGEVGALVGSARYSLLVQTPLLSDPGVQTAIKAAAERGVKVKLLLSPRFKANRQAAKLLAPAGVETRWDEGNARYLIGDLGRFGLGSFQLMAGSLDDRLESAYFSEDRVLAVELARLFNARWKAAYREEPSLRSLMEEFNALPDPRDPEDMAPRLKTKRRR